jgi:predicted transcriptional regulator
MQSTAHATDPLATIERHLIRIEQVLELQTIAIAQLRDELVLHPSKVDERPIIG